MDATFIYCNSKILHAFFPWLTSDWHILLVRFFLLPSPRKRSAPNAGGLVRGALGSAMEPICPDSGHTKDNKTNESSATGDRPIGPSMAVLQQLSSHLLHSGVYVGYYRCLGWRRSKEISSQKAEPWHKNARIDCDEAWQMLVSLAHHPVCQRTQAVWRKRGKASSRACSIWHIANVRGNVVRVKGQKKLPLFLNSWVS